MTYGNINRLDSEPGSQSYPYSLTFIYNLSIATRLLAGLFMSAAQQGFSTTNGWRIQKEP